MLIQDRSFIPSFKFLDQYPLILTKSAWFFCWLWHLPSKGGNSSRLWYTIFICRQRKLKENLVTFSSPLARCQAMIEVEFKHDWVSDTNLSILDVYRSEQRNCGRKPLVYHTEGSSSQWFLSNWIYFDWLESPSRNKEDLLDLIAGMQSRRMDEQRASLPRLPGLNSTNPDILRRLSSQGTNVGTGANSGSSSTIDEGANSASTLPDDNFFEMLMRCQGTRLEDQRSALPDSSPRRPRGPTMPDEDFFTLIMRLQSGRLEDQRAEDPQPPLNNNTEQPPEWSSNNNSLLSDKFHLKRSRRVTYLEIKIKWKWLGLSFEKTQVLEQHRMYWNFTEALKWEDFTTSNWCVCVKTRNIS